MKPNILLLAATFAMTSCATIPGRSAPETRVVSPFAAKSCDSAKWRSWERGKPNPPAAFGTASKPRLWKALNPLAAKSWGTGEKWVSEDFGPGTPNHSRTLTFASLEWFCAPRDAR